MIRLEAQTLWKPGMAPLPQTHRDHERDITDVMVPWIMQQLSTRPQSGTDETHQRAKHTIFGRRWIWDLHPLDRNAAVPRPIEDDGRRSGTVLTFLSLSIGPGQTDSGKRQFYMPSDDDLDLIKSLYPMQDQFQPQWHLIEADLVAAGNDANTIGESSVIILLVFLRQLALKRKNAAIPPADHPITVHPPGLPDFIRRHRGAAALITIAFSLVYPGWKLARSEWFSNYSQTPIGVGVVSGIIYTWAAGLPVAIISGCIVLYIWKKLGRDD